MGLKAAKTWMMENSVLLIAGAVIAMLWANLSPRSYAALLHVPLGLGGVDLHFLVNDILMALFFALAGREVWSAMLPGGPLHRPSRAAMPILCAVGGMAGPALLYLGGAALAKRPDWNNGWAVPCATDIAFSYLIARFLLGRSHPAVTFLLLLAIVDDALGLMILAVFYPQSAVHLPYLGLSVLAVAAGLAMLRLRVHGWWWYLLGPGALSWLGFYLSGLHGALGLLPIVPVIPHEHFYSRRRGWDIIRLSGDGYRFEHQLKTPVEWILGLFGLFNAGVAVDSFGQVTLLVTVGLLLGKPLGILGTAWVGHRFLKLRLPHGVGAAEMGIVALTAGIGFTVALFVATVAFPPGPTQEAAKIGALLSFTAAAPAWLLAKVAAVRKHDPKESTAAIKEAPR